MADGGSVLRVIDGDVAISLGFDDLIRYHGRASIGGLALGFKALELGLPLLSDGAAAGPPRREITVETAFDGPGARDAFEMVTRAVTGDRYTVVPDLAPADAPEAPEGHFAFRLGCRNVGVLLVLRPGLVGDDFNALVRKGPDTAAEEDLLVTMKQDLASRLLALPADQVYQASVELTESGDGKAGPDRL